MIQTREKILEKAQMIMKDLQGKWYKETCVRKINFHKKSEAFDPQELTNDVWVISLNSIFDKIDFLTISDETGEPIFIRHFSYQVQEIKRDSNGKYYLVKKD